MAANEINFIARQMAAARAAHPAAVNPKRKKRLLLLAILLALPAALFLFRHPLMTLGARLWIVDDPPEKADAVVVLGGHVDSRPFAAAELYKRGLAPVVLVAETEKGPAVEMQLVPADVEVSTAILRKLGLPDSAVQKFGGGVTSTREEAQGVRRWLEQHPATCIIIPTDPFHTRRVRYIFQRELKDLPVRVIVTSIPSKRYDPFQWWKSEEATVGFQNEIIKLAHYWLH